MIHRNIRSATAVAAVAASAILGLGMTAGAQSLGDLSSGSGDLSAGSAGSSGSAGGPPICLHTDVTPVFSWGWLSLGGPPPTYVEGPTGASGNGSLQFDSPAAGQSNYFHPAGLISLGEASSSPMSYRFRANVNFQMRIRGADTDGIDTFTTLVWSPSLNGVANDENNFQTSPDLSGGQWWSRRDIAGTPAGSGNAKTLAAIAADNPGARVTEYGLQVGGANQPARTAWGDDVQFNCSRWDFEPGLFGTGSAGSSGSGTGS